MSCFGTGVRFPPPPPAFARHGASSAVAGLRLASPLPRSEEQARAKAGARRRLGEGGPFDGSGDFEEAMRYVYLLESERDPAQRYVGLTHDLAARLAEHNAGKSPHTSKYIPWRIVVAVRFEDDARAVQFERYLKSGSGREFALRHFW